MSSAAASIATCTPVLHSLAQRRARTDLALDMPQSFLSRLAHGDILQGARTDQRQRLARSAAVSGNA